MGLRGYALISGLHVISRESLMIYHSCYRKNWLPRAYESFQRKGENLKELQNFPLGYGR